MDSFNNNDPLKQFVKDKLADYNAKVPPSGWEKLESSIFAAQRAKIVRRRWIASSMTAAAAALIGVFFALQNLNRELPVQISEHQTITDTESVAKDNGSTVSKQNVPQKQRSIQTLTADNTTSIKEKALNADSKTQIQEEQPYEAIYSDRKDLSLVPLEEKRQTNNINNQSDIDDETKQRLIEEFINEGKRSLSSTDEVATSKIKKKRRNSISLTSQSGLSSSQQTSNSPTTLRSSLADSYSNYTIAKIQSFNEEAVPVATSEMNHMQPLSFGILASFDISHKLQIESGLVYTYLLSKNKNKTDGYNEVEKMQFHYLGIPLNLNYTILSVNKLNVYLSAGTMIEKDIRGRVNYNDEKETTSQSSGYASYKSSKIKQQNPQFSVTSGVGITYPIYDKTQMFGKVGGRYYFNAKNEYTTYYSDQKFGLDIQLGIKFNF